MSNSASEEIGNYPVENVDVASLQIAFGQAVLLMHKETHPTLDGLAEIWISKSAFMAHHARIAGYKALMNFLSLKRTHASQKEQKILAVEILRLENSVKVLESFSYPGGYYLWSMNRQLNSGPNREKSRIIIGEAKPNLHCGTRGANGKLANIKKQCKSRLARVKKWLKRN
jgi:hypothetical protein